jgi:hypothetical protein
MTCNRRSFTLKNKKEGKEADKNKEKEIKISDLVCGQYTNACKLGVN